MVRPERFELPTAWFVARYSIQLSYGRAVHNQILLHFQRRMLKTCRVVRPEIRTPDRLVRSQVLYPAELRAPCDRSGIMRMSARTVNSFVKIFIQLNEKAVRHSVRGLQPGEMIRTRAQFLRRQHAQLRVHIRQLGAMSASIRSVPTSRVPSTPPARCHARAPSVRRGLRPCRPRHSGCSGPRAQSAISPRASVPPKPRRRPCSTPWRCAIHGRKR